MSKITWESICSQLQNKLPVEVYQKWLDNFELLNVEGTSVFIGYYDKKTCSEMTSTYMNDIFNAVSSALGEIATVKFKQVEPKAQQPEFAPQQPQYAAPQQPQYMPPQQPQYMPPQQPQYMPPQQPQYMPPQQPQYMPPQDNGQYMPPYAQAPAYGTQPAYTDGSQGYVPPYAQNQQGVNFTPNYDTAHVETEEKAVKTKKKKEKKEKTKKKGKFKVAQIIGAILCVLLAAAIIVVGYNVILNTNFKETFYTVSSTKVHDNLRIIQISDLHSVSYGDANSKLVNRIEALQPDLIVLTGDCVDSAGSSAVVDNLCTKLVEIAPTYYIYGNNEEEIAFNCDMTLDSLDAKFGFDDDNRKPSALYKSDNGLKDELESTGVKVLFNESDTITIGKSTIEVFGVLTANSSAFWQYAGEGFQSYLDDSTANFKLLLTHEPYIFENLDEETWGDLALCGHNHGGVVRVPKFGALYARGEGLLPERNGAFVIGKYKAGDTPVIVSTGLTNSGIRIHNQPELVIVDVSKY